MTNERQVLRVLNPMLEAMRQALANQEKAGAHQQWAVERQAAHLRLYSVVLIGGGPMVVLLGRLFVVARP